MGGTMQEAYAQPDGWKLVCSSWDPMKLLRNANVFTSAVLVLILRAAIHKSKSFTRK